MHHRRRRTAVVALLSLLFQIFSAFPVRAEAPSEPKGPGPLPPRARWVEQTDRRGPNERHWTAGDYVVSEISAAPVHARDSQGKWQAIDTTAVATAEGFQVNGGNYLATFTKNENHNRVSIDLGRGRTIAMDLDEAVEETGRPVLPEQRAAFGATAQGNKVRYSERRGLLDYDYEMTTWGVKELITLRKPLSKNQFVLPMVVDGLMIREEGGGAYSLVQPGSDDVKAVIPPPVGSDAGGVPAPVQQGLVRHGDGMALVVTVDPEWLAAPERRYPVVIDPSVAISPEGTDLMTATLLNPSSGYPNVMNLMNYYGTEKRTLLKFNLGSIPRGALVYSAAINYKTKNSSGTYVTLSDIWVQEVKTEWYPGVASWTSPKGQGTTWTGGGDLGTANLADSQTGPAALKALVQGWVSGSKVNGGVAFRRTATGDSNEYTIEAPSLQVIYALDFIKPTVSQTVTTGTGNAPVQVTVTASDPAPGGIERVKLLIDGLVIDEATLPGASTTFSVDRRRIGNGNHTIVSQAFDLAGNLAETAGTAVTIALPAMPYSLTAVPGTTGAALAWDKPVTTDATVTYNIYRTLSRTTAPITTDRIASGLTGETYTDTSLTGPKAETYYYAVSAVKDGTESEVAIARSDWPLAPTSLSGSPINYNANRLTWSASPRSGVTYNLYRTSVIPANLVASGLTTTQYVDGKNFLMNGRLAGSLSGSTWSFSNWALTCSLSPCPVSSPSGDKFGAALKVTTGASSSGISIVSSSTRGITGAFTVSAWSKAEGVTGTADSNYAMVVTVKDAQNNTVATQTLPFSVGSHDWELKSYTYVVPELRTVTVQLVYNGSHTGTAYFSGVQVEPGTVPTAYQEWNYPPSGASYLVTAVDGTVESHPTALVSPGNHAGASVAVTPTGQSLGGGRYLVTWPAAPGAAQYNIYRSTTSWTAPPPSTMLVQGFTGTSFVDGINRIGDSSFENGNIWTMSGSSPYAQYDGGARTGTRTVKFRRTGSADPTVSVSASASSSSNQHISAMTISAYSRADAVSGGTGGDYALQASFYDTSGNLIESRSAPFSEGTHDWERAVITYVPLPSKPIWRIDVKLVFGGGRTGTVWFDDVQVEDGSTASPWQASAPGTSTMYYLIRGVTAEGGESQNTNWVSISYVGALPSPADLSVTNLGAGASQFTWTPLQGALYDVQRARVDSAGVVGEYRTVAQGVTTVPYRPPGRNLLTNSGFEETSLVGWSTYSSFVYSNTFSGNYALNMSRSSNYESANWATQTVTIDQTKAMPLTLSAAISSCSNVELKLEFLDATGSAIGTGLANSSCASGMPTVSVTVTPSAPAKAARVTLRRAWGTGNAYIDNVQLEAGSLASAWTDETIADGLTFAYRVVAVISSGSYYGGYSNAVKLTNTAPAMAVSNITAQSGSNGQVAVSWGASPTPRVTYSVFRVDGNREATDRDRIATGLSATSFTDPGNLLSNSGFEHDTDKNGLLDNWNLADGTISGALDTSSAKYGSASLKVSRASADGVIGLTQSITLAQATAAPVTFSGWSKASGMVAATAADYGIFIRLESENGQDAGSATATFTAGTHDWEQKVVTITPTLPAARATVEVRLKGTATGTAWFDGLQLQPGTTATAWVDGPVFPDQTYRYYVTTLSALGLLTQSPAPGSAVSRSWIVSGPAGDPPGLGLDDRWAFADFPVPEGTAYVNLNTGNLVILATDSVVTGPRLAQAVRRTYNSLDQTHASFPMGPQGWYLNAVQRIQREANGDITLVEGDGTALRFVKQLDGSFEAPPSVWMTLTADTVPYAYRVTRRDGIVYQFDFDAATGRGRLLRLSEPHQKEITYAYNAQGYLATVTGPLAGQVANLYYDANGRVTSVTDAADRTTTYGYDSVSGLLNAVTSPLAVTVRYEYAGERLSKVTDGAGRAILFEYWPDGKFKSFRWQDVTGTVTFSYAPDGAFTKTTVTDGLNQPSVMTTNRVGNLVERQDALGNSVRYLYDSVQRLTRMTDARGLATEVAYEAGPATPRVRAVTVKAAEDLTTTFDSYSAYDKPGLITNPAGVKTLIQYNAYGDVTSQTTASGTALAATSTTSYGPDLMPASVTDPLGNTTAYVFDFIYRRTTVTNPAGARVIYEYDAAGNLVKETDPYGAVTTHTFDAGGRRLRTTNAEGAELRWDYDRSGLLVEETHPGGERITYQYDGAGRLVGTTDAIGNQTNYVYDAAGRQIVTLLPNGSRERREYDAVGRTIRLYNGVNLTDSGLPIPGAVYTEYGYDAAGNLVRAKLPSGWTATAEYDLLGRVIKEVRPPATSTFTYDKLGNLQLQKDGNGKLTRYQYDLLGRLERVYDALNLSAAGDPKPDAKFTAYAYDKAGQRVSMTSARGYTTTYQYTSLGKVATETDPLGQMVFNTYDNVGRTLGTLDRDGNFTAYQYDVMGRVTEIQYDDQRSVRYSYDLNGRRTTMADSLGLTEYRYDRMGRTTEVRSPNGVVGYEYDQVGLRTKVKLPEGDTTYAYDKANRLVSMSGLTSGSLTYGPNGEVRTVSLPGNLTQTNTYDPTTNRLMTRSYTGSLTVNLSYTYDTVGNVLSVLREDSLPGEIMWSKRATYEYDDLYRLRTVDDWYNNGTTEKSTFTYDADGNRLTEQSTKYTPSNSVTTTTNSSFEYNPVGWLMKSMVGDKTTVYGYDGRGNTTSVTGPDQIERHTYDSRGLLVRSQVGNKFTYHIYNGDGQRVRRRVATLNASYSGAAYTYTESTTESAWYQYDGIYVMAERDGSGSLRTVYGRTQDGELLSWYKPQQTQRNGSYVVDHLGSVLHVVAASDGKVLNQYDYNAFGKAAALKDIGTNDLKFTGALQDTTGLYHLNARFYNPAVGRFITQDSWRGDPWQPWTQNLYVYVGNNPINYIDPTGHMPWDAKKLLQQHQSNIAASASKYGVDPTVIAAVLYNENRVRFFAHEAKDFLGEINSLLGPGDVSLGVGQMTISTALYLDFGPPSAATGTEFDKAKFAVLKASDQSTRMDYMSRLKDAATNIDYVAKYLAYLQKAGNFDSPEKLLDAYNNNTWTDEPTAYGQRYQEILEILKDLGVTFDSPSSSPE